MSSLLQTIMIELNNSCNLNCSMCMIENRKTPFMNIDLFKNILKQWESSNICFDLYMPFFRGEPLLHPQFMEFIELFTKHNSSYSLAKSIAFDTNANLLSKDITDFILLNGQFSTITFSIDAIKNKTYNKIRIGGDLEKVKENIIRFLNTRKKYKLKFPVVRLQFIVMEENIDEADEFIDFWKEQYTELTHDLEIKFEYDDNPGENDCIFFRPCMMKDQYREIELRDLYDQLYNDITGNEKKGENPGIICSGPFSHTVITSDGLVLPCCVDNDDRLIVGDLKKESFISILNGEALRNIRKLHLKGNSSKIDVCRDCPGQFFPVIDDNALKELKNKYEI